MIAGSVQEAREMTNRLAPGAPDRRYRQRSQVGAQCGSVFIGRYSPQPMGDYVSGPNHTLPTGGVAQVRGD